MFDHPLQMVAKVVDLAHSQHKLMTKYFQAEDNYQREKRENKTLRREVLELEESYRELERKFKATEAKLKRLEKKT